MSNTYAGWRVMRLAYRKTAANESDDGLGLLRLLFSQILQNLLLVRWNRPVFLWANIQQ